MLMLMLMTEHCKKLSVQNARCRKCQQDMLPPLQQPHL